MATLEEEEEEEEEEDEEEVEEEEEEENKKKRRRRRRKRRRKKEKHFSRLATYWFGTFDILSHDSVVALKDERYIVIKAYKFIIFEILILSLTTLH